MLVLLVIVISYMHSGIKPIIEPLVRSAFEISGLTP